MFIVKELYKRAIFYSVVIYLLSIVYPSPFAHTTLFGLQPILYFILGYCFWELLPLTTVHFQYLKYNKQTELSIDKNNRLIIIKEGDNVSSFRFDQIIKIHLALMGAIYEGQKTGWVTLNRYHYALIETQDGHRYFITCLLINDLMKFFIENELEFWKEQIFWPRIRLARYDK